MRWPGAVTVAKGGHYCSIYVGDGIKKGEKLNNKEFSKFSTPTTDLIKLQEQINRLRIKPSTNKEPEIKKGPRGGRYTEDKTKDGRPYRRYF